MTVRRPTGSSIAVFRRYLYGHETRLERGVRQAEAELE